MEREVRYMTEEELSAKTDTVVDKFAELATSAENSAATLKALCEVMNVDPIAMKQRMVMNALKNDGKGYPGDLYTDALEVIGTLIHARDRYKDELELVKDANDTLKKNWANNMKSREEDLSKIGRATLELKLSSAILGGFRHKRRYTEDDMNRAQLNVYDQFCKNNERIIKILTEDFEE